ncbi:hypothetical protein [Tateyamaria pelophila]|uniref:hypothetical protein n=1 Tax=Tateyamaria pelophila TaxID=328415 RepID=UPI001CBCFB66|nr:hypothetical protein [Tateyamaria pelophila]
MIEFADFTFELKKVVCYGFRNNAGGTTTVLNFSSVGAAHEFREAFLQTRNFLVIRNDAQLICMTDYESVMRKSEDDPRVRFLHFPPNGSKPPASSRSASANLSLIFSPEF